MYKINIPNNKSTNYINKKNYYIEAIYEKYAVLYVDFWDNDTDFIIEIKIYDFDLGRICSNDFYHFEEICYVTSINNVVYFILRNNNQFQLHIINTDNFLKKHLYTLLPVCSQTVTNTSFLFQVRDFLIFQTAEQEIFLQFRNLYDNYQYYKINTTLNEIVLTPFLNEFYTKHNFCFLDIINIGGENRSLIKTGLMDAYAAKLYCAYISNKSFDYEEYLFIQNIDGKDKIIAKCNSKQSIVYLGKDDEKIYYEIIDIEYSKNKLQALYTIDKMFFQVSKKAYCYNKKTDTNIPFNIGLHNLDNFHTIGSKLYILDNNKLYDMDMSLKYDLSAIVNENPIYQKQFVYTDNTGSTIYDIINDKFYSNNHGYICVFGNDIIFYEYY